MESSEFDIEYDPLADPDIYVLVRQGQVEATLTDADLQGLLKIVRDAHRQERQRQRRGPQHGPAAALSQAFCSPAGPFVLVELLELKLQAVCERLRERHGLRPAAEERRRLFGPDQ